MTQTPPPAEMLTTLLRLREVLAGAGLSLDLPGVDEHRTSRDQMVAQLEDYVLPRMMQLDAPLVAVVGGSTGAGKSTLVNTLVGHRVTETGVLRPTTRSPVLVHHPDDGEWFEQARILPDLARTTGAAAGDPGRLHLVSTASVPPGLAVLDAPDIDSVEERNRTLATQLLAAADLWLFVTSAARYADQVPWDFLKAAAERSTAVAVVLDRTPDAAAEEVRGHLGRMLTSRGLRDSPLFVVPERPVGPDGLLPSSAVAQVRSWLDALASDAEGRAGVVRQTLDGAVRTLSRRTHVVADACVEQAETTARLRSEVDTAYARAREEVDRASADGTMLRGEVLARWQDFVGTGEMLRSLETRVGWLRDRVVSMARGRPQQVERVSVAVESGLERLILEHAEAAAERSASAWSSLEAGRHLLEDAGGDLGRASRDLRPRVERAVRDWQQEVFETVRREGADRRSTARFLAYGLNGLSVSLMVVVFASTAGVTGAEVGIAGGSAVVGQKLLEAVFGDQAVRRLAEHARTDLDGRVAELLEGERDRFTRLLDRVAVEPEAAERLRAVARRVDDLRLTRATDPGGAP